MYLLIVILLVLVILGLPQMPYTAHWNAGYFPSGMLGVVLIIVLILALMGRF
jgi:hypothetical protein